MSVIARDSTKGVPKEPERRGRRLGTLANIKTALADVYRRLEARELNANEARARVYTLAEIAKIILDAQPPPSSPGRELSTEELEEAEREMLANRMS
jgi:hypothetical protein